VTSQKNRHQRRRHDELAEGAVTNAKLANATVTAGETGAGSDRQLER